MVRCVPSGRSQRVRHPFRPGQTPTARLFLTPLQLCTANSAIFSVYGQAFFRHICHCYNWGAYSVHRKNLVFHSPCRLHGNHPVPFQTETIRDADCGKWPATDCALRTLSEDFKGPAQCPWQFSEISANFIGIQDRQIHPSALSYWSWCYKLTKLL
jgi:hypothetical protein